MKRKYDADHFYINISDIIDKSELESDFPSHFYDAYYKGKRFVSQKIQTESKKFDLRWIETIESYLSSIDMIARTVKSNLRYESEVVPVELAKNVNSESIVYLTQHTEDIKEVSDVGVTPSRILTSLSEIEYGIYENRFIMTLIIRLKDFVNERMKILKDQLKTSKKLNFNFESNFTYEDTDCKISVNIDQIENLEKKQLDEYNQNVFERGERLAKLINRINRSAFMDLMKGYPKVKPPIMKTQVILKNPHFKNAYLLWLYLDKHSELHFDFETETKQKKITSDYDKKINQVMLYLFSTLLLNDDEESDGIESKEPIVYRKTKPETPENFTPIIEIKEDTISVEDTGLNEYFLNRGKQLFRRQLDQLVEQNGNYRIGLRQAITDTLNITNALYANFFEVNNDQDIFSRLIRSEDPLDAFADTLEKRNIAQIIREVKEKDYLDAIQLEKKWNQELIAKQENLIKSEQDKANENLSSYIEEQKEKFSSERKAIEAEAAKERLEIMKANKEDLLEFDKYLKAKLLLEKARIMEEEKKNLSQIKDKMKEQEKKRREKDLANHKRKTELLIEKQKQEKEIMRKKQQEEVKALKKKALEVKKATEAKEKKKLLEKQKVATTKNKPSTSKRIKSVVMKDN